MEEISYLKVGRLNRTFGLKGHIRAFIEPAIISRLKKLEVIFIHLKNTHIPHFLDESDLNESGHCMFHFEEVKDKTAADALVGKEIYIDPSILRKVKPYEAIGDFIGFKLIDEKSGDLGILENVTVLPNHDVGHFLYQGKEILFPWNEQVILKIDKRKKEISIRLPEGLMDVYL